MASVVDPAMLDIVDQTNRLYVWVCPASLTIQVQLACSPTALQQESGLAFENQTESKISLKRSRFN